MMKKATRRELIDQLIYAVKCLEYCRKNHPDKQKGEGVTAEAVMKEVLSRA